MTCLVCGSEAGREVESFGGGRRFFCEPCGGYYQISDTLDAILRGRSFDVEPTRAHLERERNRLNIHPRGPAEHQSEPILFGHDDRFLVG